MPDKRDRNVAASLIFLYMNDYYDPYNMQGCDPYQGMTEEERMEAGCLHAAAFVVVFFVALLLCALMGGCTTTKYVPVTEHHTEHHWHTDSVRQRDSTHTERETIIREVDSAEMARYGIQMQANQRAWLVLQREMENRLRELEHRSAQRDTVHDSIPVPYPVEVEVERKRSAVEWGLILIGIAALLCGIVWIARK